MAVFTLAVEGVHDDAVARRLCEVTGHAVGSSYIAKGKIKLGQSLRGYNNAARLSWWLVLRDLDFDEGCAPSLISRVLPDRADKMLLRVPIRSVESWLLADREGIADYLGISVDVVPREPEQLERPKRTLVDLARRSSRRGVRNEMVPGPGLSSEVGPGYTRHVLEFVGARWNPFYAADYSDSLSRCLRALQAV